MQMPDLKNRMNQAGEKARAFLLTEGDKTLDFLYITGIQSVRILKRVHRRLVRFSRPAVDFIRRVYDFFIGRQIRRAERELQSISEGFDIARHRIAQAKKQGYLRVLREYARVTGESLIRHKRAVCTVLNVVAPVASILILLATVQHWNGLNYGLNLSYDGQQVATIQNEKVFEQATAMVSQRMVHSADSQTTELKATPCFQLSVVSPASYSSVNTVCNRIIQQSDDIIEEASGLYVGGQLIGAVKSSADLNYILQNILNKARGSDTSATAEFIQNVETVNGLFPTTSIMTTENMKSLLSGTSKEAVVYTVKDGDTATSIAKDHNLTLSQLKAINGDRVGDDIHPGDLVNVEVAVPKLGVQLIKSVTYQVPIVYKTVTNQDSSKYTDYSKVTTQGQNGVQENVDKVYYVNGVESKRESVSQKVLKQPVDKVVVTGTKKRPKVSSAGQSTGSLMWPVPSLHMITTYFTWRWGKFHPGIDISGSGAYGKTIVAADGGTVISAGWSNGYGQCVEINHGGGLHTFYAHASALLVSAGQKVSKGQAIARVGSTGYSTGPHCHFEVRLNGTKVNPLSYVKK